MGHVVEKRKRGKGEWCLNFLENQDCSINCGHV